MRIVAIPVVCCALLGCATGVCAAGDLADLHRKQSSCNAWDVYILTEIEDAGRRAAASGEALLEAYQQWRLARSLCARGRYAEAFDLFSSIEIVEEEPKTFRGAEAQRRGP